jgi:uncharacterized protein YkwD
MAEACTNCYIFKDSLISKNYTFRYDNWTMASWMLAKVNTLRRSVIYDDDLSELTISSEMMAAAQRRVQEITTNFSHHGSITDAENIYQISNISNDIINTLYTGWYNSEGHRNNMVYEDWNYFGFAVTIGSDGLMYAVQVFSCDNVVY